MAESHCSTRVPPCLNTTSAQRMWLKEAGGQTVLRSLRLFQSVFTLFLGRKLDITSMNGCSASYLFPVQLRTWPAVLIISSSLSPPPPASTPSFCVCVHFAVFQFQSEFPTSRFPVALLCYLLMYGSANTVKAEPWIPIFPVCQRQNETYVNKLEKDFNSSCKNNVER